LEHVTTDEILELNLDDHKSIVRSLAFSPTNEGLLISGGSNESKVRLWNTEIGKVVSFFEGL